MLAFTKPNSPDSRRRAHRLCCVNHTSGPLSSLMPHQSGFSDLWWILLISKHDAQRRAPGDPGLHPSKLKARVLCVKHQKPNTQTQTSNQGQEAPREPQVQPAISRSKQLSSRRMLCSQSLSTTTNFPAPVSQYLASLPVKTHFLVSAWGSPPPWCTPTR